MRPRLIKFAWFAGVPFPVGKTKSWPLFGQAISTHVRRFRRWVPREPCARPIPTSARQKRHIDRRAAGHEADCPSNPCRPSEGHEAPERNPVNIAVSMIGRQRPFQTVHDGLDFGPRVGISTPTFSWPFWRLSARRSAPFCAARSQTHERRCAPRARVHCASAESPKAPGDLSQHCGRRAASTASPVAGSPRRNLSSKSLTSGAEICGA